MLYKVLTYVLSNNNSNNGQKGQSNKLDVTRLEPWVSDEIFTEDDASDVLMQIHNAKKEKARYKAINKLIEGAYFAGYNDGMKDSDGKILEILKQYHM